MDIVATQNTLRDFGRYLQAFRHAKGISLAQVTQLTRITQANLRHIENEEIDMLPAGIFVKGFLRAFAEAVGADPQEAVRRYEASCRRKALLDQNQAQRHGRRFFLLRLLGALLLFALLVGATLYYAHYRSLSGGGNVVSEDIHAPVSGENPPEDATDKMEKFPQEQAGGPLADIAGNPMKSPTGVAEAETDLVLEVESVESSWVKIISDGGAPQEFNMQPDDKLTLKAKDGFSLLIGNAGGIRIIFNGKPVHHLGQSGQVVTLQLP